MSAGQGIGRPGIARTEAPTYRTVHQRLSKWRGKEKCCEFCGKNDPNAWYEWALSHEATQLVYGNDGRSYSLNLDDYVRLCRPCHVRYDGHIPPRHWEVVPQA